MPRAERFARRADLLWPPKGSSTARADRGAQFPPRSVTAAGIARTINPNGYHRSPINRPASPPYEIFCSISSSSCFFATDEHTARHRRTRRRIRSRRRRRGSSSGTHHRGTRLRRSPPAVSGKLSSDLTNEHRSRVSLFFLFIEFVAVLQLCRFDRPCGRIPCSAPMLGYA